MKELKMEIKVPYDFITYNGTNMMEFYEFAKKYDLLEYDSGQDETPGLTVRPKDVPNLSEDELIKWWESTGEIKECKSAYSEPKTYNTHNMNNLPMWHKDEEFMLAVRSGRDGYLSREFIRKGDTLVVFGNSFRFLTIPPGDIPGFIKGVINVKYSLLSEVA